MYTHSNNETVKRINVSKIANRSTLGDNSTAAGCDSTLVTRRKSLSLITERLSSAAAAFRESSNPIYKTSYDSLTTVLR